MEGSSRIVMMRSCAIKYYDIAITYYSMDSFDSGSSEGCGRLSKLKSSQSIQKSGR
jgi:hypothetical protein